MKTNMPLSRKQIQAIYTESATYPSYFTGLVPYQKERLYAYAKGQRRRIEGIAQGLARDHEDECAGCKQCATYEWKEVRQYWLDKIPEYVANQKVLALFTPLQAAEVVHVQPKKKARVTEKPAQSILQRGLSLEGVCSVFNLARPHVKRKSEWAIVIAALRSEGYLVGSADKLEAWLKEGKFGISVSDRTISDYTSYYDSEADFSKDEQRIIDSVLTWAAEEVVKAEEKNIG